MRTALANLVVVLTTAVGTVVALAKWRQWQIDRAIEELEQHANRENVK